MSIAAQISALSGLIVIVDPNCYKSYYVQFRFPRSKKIMIRRKFAKDKKNFKLVIEPLAIRMGGDSILSSYHRQKAKRVL